MKSGQHLNSSGVAMRRCRTPMLKGSGAGGGPRRSGTSSPRRVNFNFRKFFNEGGSSASTPNPHGSGSNNSSQSHTHSHSQGLSGAMVLGRAAGSTGGAAPFRRNRVVCGGPEGGGLALSVTGGGGAVNTGHASSSQSVPKAVTMSMSLNMANLSLSGGGSGHGSGGPMSVRNPARPPRVLSSSRRQPPSSGGQQAASPSAASSRTGSPSSFNLVGVVLVGGWVGG
jgi:hypothetical protein